MQRTLRRGTAALPVLSALAALSLLSTLATPAAAQRVSGAGPVPAIASRFGGGFSGLVAQPRDDFANYVKVGGGFGGDFLVKLDPVGVTALRFDVGFVNYGNDKRRVPLSPTLGNLIMVDLTTTNNIALIGTGLQLQAPRGPVRPYIAGEGGLAYFFTTASVNGTANGEYQSFASSTKSKDAVFSLAGLGGIYVPLGGAWGLDLGASYQKTGEATYMRKESIQDVNGTPTTAPPITSKTNMIVYRIGVRFGQ